MAKSALLILNAMLVIFLLSACASLDFSDHQQTVLVTSQPAGASIYQRGEKLGETPAYVRVQREEHPEISVARGTEPAHVLRLKTHYRWTDSFFGNMAFLTLAPAGWLVDWATGTAWEIDDPPEQKMASGGDMPHRERTPLTIAVAPPTGPELEVADALGPLIADRLRKDKEWRVLNYADTVAMFGYYGSDEGLTRSKSLSHNLFYELKADRVIFSHAELTDNGYRIVGKLKNVYDEKDSRPFALEVTPSDGALKAEVSRQKIFNQYFHIIPNTLFLNFSSYQSQVQIDQTQYTGQNAGGASFTDKLIDSVSVINLDHLDRPRANVRGHWFFQFVPTLEVSKKRLTFDNYTPLQGAEFDRIYADVGYGIDVGHESQIGRFYLDIIPTVDWTQITINQPLGQTQMSSTSVTASYELGYTRFLGDHFVGKLFVRSVAEDSNLWSRAIHQVSGKSEDISSVSSIFEGIAIGYYIPSSLKTDSGWHVSDKASE